MLNETNVLFPETIYSAFFTNVKGHINHYAKQQREWPFTVPHMHTRLLLFPPPRAIKKNAKYVNNKEMAKTKKNNGSWNNKVGDTLFFQVFFLVHAGLKIENDRVEKFCVTFVHLLLGWAFYSCQFSTCMKQEWHSSYSANKFLKYRKGSDVFSHWLFDNSQSSIIHG